MKKISYLYIDSREPDTTRRCINGKVTGRNKCHGYCLCRLHPGFLTDRLITVHECMEKQCFHFVPKEKKEEFVIHPDVSGIVLSH